MLLCIEHRTVATSPYTLYNEPFNRMPGERPQVTRLVLPEDASLGQAPINYPIISLSMTKDWPNAEGQLAPLKYLSSP